MPPCILCFYIYLRLIVIHYEVQYVPRKHQVTADALSCAPVGIPEQADNLFAEVVEALATQTTASLP